MQKKSLRVRRLAGSTVIGVVCLLLAAYGLFQVSKSRTFQFFGGLTDRVETEAKVIALTFDDGPGPESTTTPVLAALGQAQVKGTFYNIGAAMAEYPDQAQLMVAAGHELGNHSYTHQRFLLKSLPFIEREIQDTNRLIREAGYSGEITFRPPNGKKLFALPWYLKQQGMKTIMWDVEPDTYVPGDADAIVRYTLERTRPGSIILMHPFCQAQCEADRAALPRIIDGLKQQGYTFVTVTELLSRQQTL